MVQVVLNSMLSWEAPPRPWRPELPPPEEMTVRSGQSPAFRVARTGYYDAAWTVGPPRVIGRPMCPYSLDLRAADGHSIHMGDGTTAGDRRTSGAFLGAGRWTVDLNTTGAWQLVLTPWIGSRGGGARGF